MNIGDIIRDKALAEARTELADLAAKCDNLWTLGHAIRAFQEAGERADPGIPVHPTAKGGNLDPAFIVKGD